MAEERNIETSKPADKPTFTIKIENEELSREFQILSIVVNKCVNKISTARIMILDGDASVENFEASNETFFIPGNKIEIFAGYHSDEKSIYKGIIIKQGMKIRKSGPSLFSIECKHEAVKLTVGRKSKYFYESLDSDVFEEIIGTYSITTDIDATNVTHKELVQYRSTDWDFIINRSEVNGVFVFTNDEKIAIKKPELSSASVLTLLYGATILEFDGEIDSRNLYAKVKGKTWDPATQALIEGEAADPGVTETGNLSSGDLADVVGLEEFELNHSGVVAEDELQSWTDSVFLKSKLSKVRGRVKFQGYPDVKPGDIIELKGVGDRFSGKVFVSGVRHEIGSGNWTTDVQFGISPEHLALKNTVSELSASEIIPAVSGLQIGVAVQLQDDPDGEDRILIKMPLVDNNEEGIWARIASPDAGEKRGMFFRPEIGDEVILGFINDDPRDAVVLGMLNSSSKPAPLTASDENPQKGYFSREELKLIFDDEKKSVTIETPNKNTVILTDDEGAIKLEDENGNKITMDSNGITLESAKDVIIKATGDVKVEGTNVNQTANAQFKAEGSAGAELSTSATAVVKGSIVQIN